MNMTANHRFFLTVLAILVTIVSCSRKTGDGREGQEPTSEVVSEPDIQNGIKEMTARKVETLEIGQQAPAFDLKGTDGRQYRLEDFDGRKVLVVVFTCNHCPTAQAYEQRIKDIVEDYANKGVALVAISPNAPSALLYEECGYSDLGDTYGEMVIRAEDHDFNFPYLYDGDDHSASIHYGPVATPHAFVFDADRKLRYRGRIDGAEKPGTGRGEDLRNAIDAVLNGTEIKEPVTKSFGCSVKWGWKDEWTKNVNEEWAAKEVTLEMIGAEGIAALVKNDTDKLRLINIWATWCGPCVIEYPEFVIIHRMYKGRDFEFVSLSADKPAQKDKALKFLQEHHSALKNYIFDQDNAYALIELINPEWTGVLPYTLMIEPGGKIVYAHEGPIDPLALKRAIVEHPMIGRYY
jgi:peroxiredoxin